MDPLRRAAHAGSGRRGRAPSACRTVKIRSGRAERARGLVLKRRLLCCMVSGMMAGTQSADTDARSERVLLELLRKKSPADKVAQVRALSQLVIGLSRRALERANPGKSQTELDLLFIRLHYGEELARRVTEYRKAGRE